MEQTIEFDVLYTNFGAMWGDELRSVNGMREASLVASCEVRTNNYIEAAMCNAILENIEDIRTSNRLHFKVTVTEETDAEE